MSKQIMVPITLLDDIRKLLWYLNSRRYEETHYIPAEFIKKIENVIKEKQDAMEKRQAFTKYKSAQTEYEREEARLEYLDKAGIYGEWWTEDNRPNE